MPQRPRIVSPDVNRGSPRDRTPPGQTLTAKWPVLHYGGVPKVDPFKENWRLRIFGQVEKEYELTYPEIRALPAFKDSLSDDQIVELVTHLRQQFAPEKPAWSEVRAAINRIRRGILR